MYKLYTLRLQSLRKDAVANLAIIVSTILGTRIICICRDF